MAKVSRRRKKRAPFQAATQRGMRAAREIDGPTFAHFIVITRELLAALRPVSACAPPSVLTRS